MITKITPEEFAAFIKDFDALCTKHGVVVAHEDGQGCGLVRKADPNEAPGTWIIFNPWIRRMYTERG